MPDIIQKIHDAYEENPAAVLKLLPELFKQYGEGLIPVLPCKVGSEVWILRKDTSCIEYGEIQQFINYKNVIAANIRFESGRNSIISIIEFGRIVFLFLEEAKKALNERSNSD